MKKYILTFCALTLLLICASAQIENPVKWNFSHRPATNGNIELVLNAEIENGWHLYSEKPSENGPIPTSLTIDPDNTFKCIGTFKATSTPTKIFDKSFNTDVEYFSKTAIFTQEIKLTSEVATVSGHVEFMCCDDENCLPPTVVDFKLNVENIAESDSQSYNQIVDSTVSHTTIDNDTITKVSTTDTETVIEDTDSNDTKSLWTLLLTAFLAGLGAILTPCVFPMIPMNVSFFMRSNTKKKSLQTAIIFGVSTVAIYAILGALFSLGVFGPNAGEVISTHWISNTLFFILFVTFALSFFGLFEIVIPGNLSNKTDAKVDKGGFIGTFFMALTTVIVSFSCTGPFIGYLIILAVQGGGLQPLLGMSVFGLAFALPFVILAAFPSLLKKMPKSGGWLNSIKVVFAFILLALSLKFINNIKHDFISRELFLSIWIAISAMNGFYLLGKIKLLHDSDVEHVGVGRLLFSLASFAFAIYLATGLAGNPLTPISALLPSPSATSVNVQNNNSVAIPESLCGEARYSDKLHLPQGLAGYFDFDEGMRCAQSQGKPAFIVFKGHSCSNCKKMESSVWNNPETIKILSEKYVIIALYTDDRTTLPESEWKQSTTDGRILKTMGQLNRDLLLSRYNKNTIPYHVIIKPDGEELQMAVTFDSNQFRSFISQGINE